MAPCARPTPPTTSHLPGLAAAVRALEILLSGRKGDPLPAEPTYDELRFALADLDELR